jgi:class 3 adenylate cyclase
MPHNSLGRQNELNKYLDQRNAHPEQRAVVDRIIKDTFEQQMAVMITDSVGFSRLTIEYGIIHFLALLKKVNDALKPVVRKHDGQVLSEWADNFVIAFNKPNQAIKAAIEMNHAIKAHNKTAPIDSRFGICIGIGHGTVLFTGNDIFGHQVNIASKLGEDIAKDSEILVTENVYHVCKDAFSFTEGEEAVMSSMSFKYYKVEY